MIQVMKFVEFVLKFALARSVASLCVRGKDATRAGVACAGARWVHG